MASLINASTSPAGIIQTADGTGILALQTAGTTAVTIDASQNATFAGKVASAGALTLASNGTTTAVTVDTSQNVGIGTASPSQKVEINNSSNDVYLKVSRGVQSLLIGANSTGPTVQSSSTDPLYFATNGSERMRIDSSGNVFMGVTAQRYGTCRLVAEATSNQAAFLGTNYSGDVSSAAVYISKYDNNSTTSQVFVRFLINNITSGSGQINANGASAAAFGSFSDERLKENIEPLSSQLDNILALKPSEFDFKGYTDGMGHQIGFIAQDMQKVYPDVISEGEDGILMITGWSKTEARLVKAIQEQQALITSLTARITALEGA